jgi:hypothetical protein
MRTQDQKHKEGIIEIQGNFRSFFFDYNFFWNSLLSPDLLGILNNFLQNQVVENMRKQGHSSFLKRAFVVEKDITKTIDDLVKEHVAECLKDHIPRELQAEVADSKRELEELNLALYNSYVSFHFFFLLGKRFFSYPSTCLFLGKVVVPMGTCEPTNLMIFWQTFSCPTEWSILAFLEIWKSSSVLTVSNAVWCSKKTTHRH